jgi:hypothetical protein
MELVAVICPDCGDRKVASVEETPGGLALRSRFREHRAKRGPVPRVVRSVTVLPASDEDPSYWHGLSFTDSPDDLPLALECPRHGDGLRLTLGAIRNAASRARTKGKPTRLPAHRR